MKIGILALQGDFALHQKSLHQLGVETRLVRKPEHLESLDALVIPGGESTTFTKLLQEINLFNPLREFGKRHAIFGTCAGLIILANRIENDPVPTLQLIDIDVRRNAYGRQIDSFLDTIEVHLNGQKSTFEGIFIRAPKITRVGEGVRPIAYHKNDVVMAENDHILVATFHPELSNDLRIHKYFVEKAAKFS